MVEGRRVIIAYACGQCHRAKKKCTGAAIGKACIQCKKRGIAHKCVPRIDERCQKAWSAGQGEASMSNVEEVMNASDTPSYPMAPLPSLPPIPSLPGMGSLFTGGSG